MLTPQRNTSVKFPGTPCIIGPFGLRSMPKIARHGICLVSMPNTVERHGTDGHTRKKTKTNMMYSDAASRLWYTLSFLLAVINTSTACRSMQDYLLFEFDVGVWAIGTWISHGRGPSKLGLFQCFNCPSSGCLGFTFELLIRQWMFYEPFIMFPLKFILSIGMVLNWFGL